MNDYDPINLSERKTSTDAEQTQHFVVTLVGKATVGHCNVFISSKDDKIREPEDVGLDITSID